MPTPNAVSRTSISATRAKLRRTSLMGPEDVEAFPYVNGGLFQNEDVEIPRLTPELLDLILISASRDFDWSEISPTIFGAVFESTLNPETRRKGGMHYTSIENIHRLIDPLFLDDLRGDRDVLLVDEDGDFHIVRNPYTGQVRETIEGNV